MVHCARQGQDCGRCRVIRRAEEEIRAGMLVILWRVVAGGGGGGLGQAEAGEGCCSPSEVEDHHRQHQPGGVGGEHPGGTHRSTRSGSVRGRFGGLWVVVDPRAGDYGRSDQDQWPFEERACLG
jgi:hypothetical protein